MRYFIDTEFAERPNTIELISLGMVSDSGRELYIEISDFNELLCNSWVKQNVLPHLWSRHKDKREYNRWILDGGAGGLMSKAHAAQEIRKFIGDDATPEFWGYFSAYDWVGFCWLFGDMVDLPEGWPMLCLDLRQRQLQLHLSSLPPQTSQEHNALADAKWAREAAHFMDWQELLRKNADAKFDPVAIEFWSSHMPPIAVAGVPANMNMRRESDGLVVSSTDELVKADKGQFKNWYGPVYVCKVCSKKWVVDSVKTPTCRDEACESNKLVGQVTQTI